MFEWLIGNFTAGILIGMNLGSWVVVVILSILDWREKRDTRIKDCYCIGEGKGGLQ